MSSAVALSENGIAAATLRFQALAPKAVSLFDTQRSSPTNPQRSKAGGQGPAPAGGMVAKAVTLSPAQALVFDPLSPFASADGLVEAPAIDPIAEVTNQLMAGRAFAVSVKALKVADDEEKTLLNISA